MLASQHHIAEHVADIGLRDANDSAIWRYAAERQAVLVTKDEDFSHRPHRSGSSPAVVWLRLGNVSRRALLERLQPLLPEIEAAISRGERLIEVR